MFRVTFVDMSIISRRVKYYDSLCKLILDTLNAL